ncbi:MAG: hypothetical protein IPI46_11535 [Bacteroidetes bacterium]|nr:hypothetical protein [Bacteroidota bacterium]
MAYIILNGKTANNYTLQSQLKKINILLNYDNDILTYEHLAQIALPEIISFNTYNDHRITMALSMLTVQGVQN